MALNLDPWAGVLDDIDDLHSSGCAVVNSSLALLRAEDAVYTIVIPTVCIVGIVLNVVNLAVFCQSALTGTCFTFLVARAAVDLCTLVIVLPIGFSRCNCPDSGWVTYAAKMYEAYVYLPLANISATISIWVTTALTVERFVSVKKALIASKNNTICRARIIIVLLAILSLGLNFPYFFYHDVTDGNKIVLAGFVRTIAFSVYSWVRFALAKIIPCFVVFIINMFLIHEVWLAHKRRKKMIFKNSADAKRMQVQIRLTLMLIGVSVGFMIGHIPDSFSHIGVVACIFGKCAIYSDEYRYFSLVSNLLETASYAYDFFIYVLFSQQYRQVLRRTLLCYHCRGIKSNKIWPAIATNRGNTS